MESPDEIDAIVRMQEFLMSVTEDNLEDTRQAILCSDWILDISGIRQLAATFLIAAKFRVTSMPALAKLLCDLCSRGDNENALAQLKTQVLRGMFRSFACTKPVPNESAYMALLYLCYKNGMYEIGEITKRIVVMIKDYRNTRSMCWIFCYFAPEIEAKSERLYRQLVRKLQRGAEMRQFPQIFKRVEKDLETLKRNQWRILRRKRDYFDHVKTLSAIMRRDDVDALHKFAARPGFNIDMKIMPTAFTPNVYLQGHPTLIQAAAFYGSVRCFRFLLLNGADLMAVDFNFVSLPQFAVAGGNIEIIRLCQQYNVEFFGAIHVAIEFHRNEVFEWLCQTVHTDPNELDLDGQNALHAACESNNVYAMKFVLQNGVEPNARTFNGWTPLRIAVRRGYVDAVRLLLTVPGIDVNSRTRAGVTPFHLAAKFGDIQIAKLLVDHGDIEIDAVSEESLTPLFLAVQNNRAQMVRYLLNFDGINVNHRNNDQTTPLMVAICYDYASIVKMLINDPRIDLNAAVGTCFTPLFLSIKYSRRYAFNELISRPEVDVSMITPSGYSMLHLAVKTGIVEMVTQLLDRPEIDVNHADKNGVTPIHRACALGFLDIVTVLLNHPGTDASLAIKIGNTPLHSAAACGHAEIVYLLLQRPEVDVNARARGATPLDFAVTQGSIQAVLALLASPDIEINCQDELEMTPLMIAANQGDENMVALLVTLLGIDLERKSKNGLTAKQIASRKGFTRIVDLLTPPRASTPPRMKTGGAWGWFKRSQSKKGP